MKESPKNVKRVLIKLSGEALGGETGGNKTTVIDYQKVHEVAVVLARLQKQEYQIGIVVGGGNICRGRDGRVANRTDGDHMGMLATAINALALKDALLTAGASVRVLSAIPMEQVCDNYTQRKAVAYLENGEIIVFANGIGRPYFSTDTAAALRALEIDADALYCAKNIDGVYSADPAKDPKALRFDCVDYDTFMKKNLKALDQTAVALCRDNALPIYVFELNESENIAQALHGDSVGTWIRG